MINRLNNIIYRRILLIFISSLLTSLFVFDASWSLCFLPLTVTVTSFIFEINTNILLEISEPSIDKTIAVTYYNYIDKIRTEVVKLDDIAQIKRLNKKTKIEFKNRRILNLHHHKLLVNNN